MAEAKLLSKNKIDSGEIEMRQAKRRPITSDFRGGDRLPSRAWKTREKAKRIYIGIRKKPAKRQQQGLTKNVHNAHDSVSPKNNRIYGVNDNHIQARHNVHTAVPKQKMRMFEDLNQNNENEDPTPAKNSRFREKLNKKKDIIVEVEDDNEEDYDRLLQS